MARWWWGVAAPATFVMLASVPGAFAQSSDVDDTPFYDVPALDDTRPWLQWLVGLVLVALCVGVALRNPHRTHLD
jgi:hypothetical protein